MLNWVLSIMVIKDILTEEEAQHLSKELGQAIHASRFDDAHKLVTKLLEDYEKNK